MSLPKRYGQLSGVACPGPVCGAGSVNAAATTPPSSGSCADDGCPARTAAGAQPTAIARIASTRSVLIVPSPAGFGSCDTLLLAGGAEVAPLAVLAAEGGARLADGGLCRDRCAVVHTGARVRRLARRDVTAARARNSEALPHSVITAVLGARLTGC